MHVFSNILVGLDLGASGNDVSTGSRLALKQAIALARFNEARISLMHSTAADEHYEASVSGYTYRAPGISDQGMLALERAQAECRDAGLETQLQLVKERAWSEMVLAVQDKCYDLVVVGKRTEASDESNLLGSVSRKLLRKCPCPVWAVKPDGDRVPDTIVSASDRSETGDHAVSVAAALAAGWSSQLHLVSALALPMAEQMAGDRDAYESEHGSEDKKALAELAAKAGVADENVHLHVGIASPTSAIEACIKGHDADLLVIGSVGRGGLAGLLMGNTAERLLNRVDCSLLVVKPASFICPVNAIM